MGALPSHRRVKRLRVVLCVVEEAFTLRIVDQNHNCHYGTVVLWRVAILVVAQGATIHDPVELAV
jgi:hypothetical protein